MATLSYRQFAFIALAALTLSGLYLKSTAIDLERHERTLENLRQLEHWDAIQKQDILRTRTGLLNHYDTLVATMKALRATQESLTGGTDSLRQIEDNNLQRSLDEVDQVLEDRSQHLERYKMRNAVLRNSLSYLPVATNRLGFSVSSSANASYLSSEIDRILQDTLIFNLSGSFELRDELQDAVNALLDLAPSLEPEAGQAVENILSHVAIILAEKPVVDSLVSSLMDPGSLDRIEEVGRLYTFAFARAENTANQYRLVLYALSVLTVLYVAFVLMKLNRAGHALERANIELEDRVARRTAELVDMNSSLRIHLDRISTAMERVEAGDLEVQLPKIDDAVYANLYRRFNYMTDGIRDEAQILQVAQELSGELKLDVLLAQIMRTTTQLLDADRSTLFIHDANTKELWSRVAEGVDVKEIRFPDSAGIAGKVLQSGQAENVTDPYSHELFNPEIDRATGYKTESILCMPIVNKFGQRVGVTQVLNKIGGKFGARDEARLRAFTAQVSISLANAQLFADVTKEKNYNEATLNSLSNGVITFDAQSLVTTVNPAAAKILRCEPQSLYGKDSTSVFGGRRGWISTQVSDLLANGQADNFLDVDISLEGGKTASVNLTVVPLRDEEETVIGGMLILEDITNEKRVKSTMARYMTKEIAEQLMEVGEDALGGRSQTATVLFSDIRGFTSISEQLGARQTVSMLNEYFTEMIEVIFKNKGILDKYIGDAIMAVFGTPFPAPDDTDNSVVVANRMMEVLRELNIRRISESKDPISIGIGLSTGELISGNIGSPKRMDYTVIGDSVNLAARLESATKYYGVPILASQFTVEASNDRHRFRELDLIVVKGKTEPVSVYEALGHHTEETFSNQGQTLEAFNAGLGFYRSRDWKAAVDAFQQALTYNPDDRPTALYLERCAHYSENPPPEDWLGVWQMASK